MDQLFTSIKTFMSNDEEDDNNKARESNIEVEPNVVRKEEEAAAGNEEVPPSTSFGEISANTTGTSSSVESEPHRRRKSHFNALIEQARQESMHRNSLTFNTSPRGSASTPSRIVEEEEGEEEEEGKDEEEQKEPDDGGGESQQQQRQSSFVNLDTSDKPRRALMKKEESTYMDIGNRYDEFQAYVGNDRLVQVNLRNFSYYAPVKWDRPSIKTIFNQSVCYMSFEVFRRIHQYVRKNDNNNNKDEGSEKKQEQHQQQKQAEEGGAEEEKDGEEDDGDYRGAETVSDIVLPFEKKAILKDITIAFEPGKTYLILAPPGGGKTTLLKAIAGLIPYSLDLAGNPMKNKPHIAGKIEYNGVTKEDEPAMILPNLVSFVGQLDNHAPYLTVKETFDFAFQCRTGGTHSNFGITNEKAVSNLDRANFTENLTIEGLDLAHVANTFVGNDDVRGVSGGQRRRVTVGEMMQGQNPVACGDEISTGLDAAVTYDIVHSIVAFSQKAKTTRIISLLQPGPETVSLFDEIVLIAEGRLIYAGPIEEVVDYFAEFGYEQPPTIDVGDWVQSIPTPDGELFFHAESSPSDRHYTAAEFAEAFKKSKQYQRIIEKLDGGANPNQWTAKEQKRFSAIVPANGGKDEETGNHNSVENAKPVPKQYMVLYQNSFFKSMRLNFHRHLTLWTRDKGFIIGKMFENIGMAVATGGILFGAARLKKLGDESTPVDERIDNAYELIAGVYGALFMTTFHILLGTMTSAPDEIDGRSIHYKHDDANFYQSFAFVFGRLISTFPQRTIEIVSFGIPLYFMVGLDLSASSFFIYLALLICYTIGLKLMFSILAQALPKKANVQGVGTFIVLIMSLFSGFIVFPDSLPGFYNWLYYINPMAWTLQGLVVSEFTSNKYTSVGDIGVAVGTSFLEIRGYKTDRIWVWYTFAFLIPFVFLSGLALGAVLKLVRIEPEVSDLTRKNKITIGEAEEDEDDDFNLPFTPVDLTFDKLVYEVKASTGDETLKLLNEVSGVFAAGRMVALMGSSGAGKTTLMDVIAMRKDSGTITGDIRLNGFPQERQSFLRVSGYIEQFDIQQPELTVQETVEFCAKLRLDANDPGIKDTRGKIRFAKHVMKMMELTDIRTLQVGSYEEGGLSFEQRKRLAIACELAGSPSVIFLDEPTSGLDSRGALVVMRAMKRIADSGRTVCSTVHQPSGAVFEMFDDLLLLKKGGNTVFFGELGPESIHLIKYFEDRGANPIEYGENPAAWMLRAQTIGAAAEVDWAKAFKDSEQYENLRTRLDNATESLDETKKLNFEEEFPTTKKERVQLMNQRVVTIYKRSPAYNLARLMIAALYAFIIGSVFLTGGSRRAIWTENEVDAVISTIFFSLIVIGVTSISMAVPVTKTLRDVFYKHRASGMLTHKALSSALFIGEIPYLCLISILFGIIYYGCVGLFTTLKKFWYFFLFFTLNVANYAYFGQAFICLVKDTPTAGALMGALIGYNVFFSGLIVLPQYFRGPFQIGFWTAPGRFAFEGLTMTQFNGVTAPVHAECNSPFYFEVGCADNITKAIEMGCDETCVGTMEQYVNFYFGGKFSINNFWLDLGALLGYLLLTHLLSFWALAKFNYSNSG